MSNPDSIRADAILCISDITDEQARAAALTLAAHADSADELTGWLEMCGLLPYQAVKPKLRGCAGTVINYRRPGQ